MRDHQQHISDEELLLAADHETGRRAQRVRAHTEACDRCRLRAAQMGGVLMELARAQRNTTELPSIDAPRALLRTRLAKLSNSEPGFVARLRMFAGFSAVRPALAALTIIMIAATF